MNAQNLNGFEQSILNSGVDLAGFKKSAPLKTAEDIRRDWLLERIGKFTASEFYKLVTYPKKSELPAGAITYCTEKAAETLTEFLDDRFVSAEMQWGIDHELEAIAAFKKKTGFKILNTGTNQKFLTLGDSIGGTPDGVINKVSGIEVKCPNSTTHLKYLGIKNTEHLKKICANYYWQVQGMMYITGCSHWYFISYDPRYKLKEHQLHILKIEKHQTDQEFLIERLGLAINYRNDLLRELSPDISQIEVLALLKISRTKLWNLRKTETFPKPVQANPLRWKLSEIESYTKKKH